MARVKAVTQLTIKQFDSMFPNEDACKAYLVARRWPEGVHFAPAVATLTCTRSKIAPIIGSAPNALRRAAIASHVLGRDDLREHE